MYQISLIHLFRSNRNGKYKSNIYKDKFYNKYCEKGIKSVNNGERTLKLSMPDF